MTRASHYLSYLLETTIIRCMTGIVSRHHCSALASTPYYATCTTTLTDYESPKRRPALSVAGQREAVPLLTGKQASTERGQEATKTSEETLQDLNNT